MKRINTNIIHKELSYLLQGCIYDVRNTYGSGHKEKVYQNLLIEHLEENNILVKKEHRISVYSYKTKKSVGCYIPDLIIEDKIIVEIKATNFTITKNIEQLDYYLKNSCYEVGYLINFGATNLYIKRRIFTNDRKPFLKHIRDHS